MLIDGAHNLHGMKALEKVIKQLFSDRKLILGIGVLKDKDVEGMFACDRSSGRKACLNRTE